MGNFLAQVKEEVAETIFLLLHKVFEPVIDYLIKVPRMICDMLFPDAQFEHSSEQDQIQTREQIEEQRLRIANFRRLMTCRCCNERLVDYTFDCGDMACQQCNDTRCAQQCFSCNLNIRARIHMDYDRSALL